MNEHDNDDLRLVAAFREDIDETTPERMASVRAEFLKGRNMNAPKTFFTPRRVAAFALPAVAAIALGAVALGSIGGGNSPTQGTSQQSAFDIAGASASEVLELAAQNVTLHNQATTGDYVYTLTSGQKVLADGDSDDTLSPWKQEDWFDLGLGVDVRGVHIEGDENDVEDFTYDHRDHPFEPAVENKLKYPTADLIAGLPEDPTALLERLRTEVRALYGEERLDEDVINASFRMLTETGPAMTPELRAAFFTMLAGMPDVTRADGLVEDGLGRAGVALGTWVRNPNNDDADVQVILDPDTGVILGERLLINGAVHHVFGFEQKLVGSADER